MKKVALVGAGGKMGCRIADNTHDSDHFDMYYLEISDAGIARLAQRGLQPTPPKKIIPEADLVVFAVPDVAMDKVTATYVPQMKSGAMGVCLDPAAAFAGHLAPREDIAYFISHPCHPSIFNYEEDEKLHYDYFGGITAKQAIVSALMQGPEEAFEQGEQLAKEMYAPVTRAHRITVEQMALLEPAMAETMAATMLQAMREGMDEVVKKGVPKEAARDFMLGHINILAAVIFNEIDGVFSDACNKAMQIGHPMIFKENWKDIFSAESLKHQVESIT